MSDKSQQDSDWVDVPAPEAGREPAKDDWEDVAPSSGGTQEPEGLAKVADYAARGLDYAGGLSRVGLANSAPARTIDLLQSYLRNKPPALNQEGDMGRALAGKAPRSDEYLERAGVSQGPSFSDATSILRGIGDKSAGPMKALSLMPDYAEPNDPNAPWYQPVKGGMLDPTLRGTIGAVGDTLTDPLSYLSALAEGAGYLKKLARGVSQPVGNAAEDLGERYYKSAWKRPDAAQGGFAKKAGVPAPSDVGLEKGMWGSEKSLEQQKDAALGAMGAEKRNVISQIQNKAIDPSTMWSPETWDHIVTLHKDPATKAEAESILQKMMDYNAAGPQTPETLALWQSNLTTAIRDSYKKGAPLIPGRKAQQEMARDIGRALEKEASATSPELGEKLTELNGQMSPLLSGSSAMRSGAKNEANRKGLFSQVGAAIAGGGLLGAGYTHGLSMLPAALFYGMKGLSSPAAKTGGGLLLNKAGQAIKASNLDALIRRGLINQSAPGKNTWDDMIKSQPNGGNQ